MTHNTGTRELANSPADIRVGDLIKFYPGRRYGGHFAHIKITKINPKTFKGEEVATSYRPGTRWKIYKTCEFAHIIYPKGMSFHERWFREREYEEPDSAPSSESIYNKLCAGRSSFNERNDCAVVAVTQVSGLIYEQVHYKFYQLGRKSKGTTPNHITKKVLKSLGLSLRPIKVGSGTVNGLELELSLSGGTYLIWTRGHVLAFVDGKIQDWTQGRKHRPKRVCEVVKGGD